MRKAFSGGVLLLGLLVATQFFLAGRGAVLADYDLHRGLGFLSVLAAAVLLLVGALTRVGRRSLTMLGIALGLLLLQPVIAKVAEGMEDLSTGGLVFGLHAVNGLIIAGMLARTVHAVGRPSQTTAAQTDGA